MMKNKTDVPVHEFQAESEVKGPGSISFHYKGNMTVYNAKTLLEEFCMTMGKYSEMSIDLSGITKIDSSAVQLMIIAKRESLIKNKTLSYINPSNEVMRMFNTYGLSHYIEGQS